MGRPKGSKNKKTQPKPDPVEVTVARADTTDTPKTVTIQSERHELAANKYRSHRSRVPNSENPQVSGPNFWKSLDPHMRTRYLGRAGCLLQHTAWIDWDDVPPRFRDAVKAMIDASGEEAKQKASKKQDTEIGSIRATVEVPVFDDGQMGTIRVDGHLAPRHRKIMHRIRMGMRRSGVALADGRYVSSSADVLRKLLEMIDSGNGSSDAS